MLAVGGIILCGGKSSRMGRSKAWLPFGPEAMLQRVARIVGGVVEPLVVVAAAGQSLPELPRHVIVVRDEYEALGPLAGLAAGLRALSGKTDAAYVSACDAPLLRPESIRFIIAALKDDDIAIPRDGKFHHPLAAVYRTSVEGEVRSLLAAGQLRPFFLLERVRTREIEVTELHAIDAALDSLRNTNTPDEYATALSMAGFAAPNASDLERSAPGRDR